MARLGLSIYPEHSELEADLAYLRMAGACGFKRVFMRLHCTISGCYNHQKR